MKDSRLSTGHGVVRRAWVLCPAHIRFCRSISTGFCVTVLLTVFIPLVGCSHLHLHSRPKAEYVYVATRQPIFLRDRVATVSNHTAQVRNGERLQVLEHMRRFLKVQTAQGVVGWVEEASVLNSAGYNSFLALRAQHERDPVTSHVVLRNDMYMHLAPGVKTEHFYLIPANTRLEMLGRASVPKAGGGIVSQAASTAKPQHGTGRRKRLAQGSGTSDALMSAVPMEDWWLVRDSAGHTGWMQSRQLDVDIPDDIAQYAEGQRMVGAYVLRMVSDPASGKPGGQVPEYVTILTPYKDGLPYDFDQVRVFTWDAKHHRYGTAFRQRNLVGYFPVTVGQQNFGSGLDPIFSIQVATGQSVGTSAGAVPTETLTYRLEGNVVRRVLPPGGKAEAISQGARQKQHRVHSASQP